MLPKHLATSVVALAVTLAGTLAACGSASTSGAKVASLGTQAPAATTAGTGTSGSTPDSSSTDKSSNPQTAFADYAKCMRGEGVDMPDPQVVKLGGSTNGQQTQTINADSATAGTGPSAGVTGGGPNINPNSDEFKAADKKCKPILDSAVGQIKIDPAVQAEQRKQMLAFAKCMRGQGLDFPDPTFQDGGVSIQVSSGSASNGSNGIAPDSAAFQAANKVCGKLLGNTGGPGLVTSGSVAG